MNQSADLLTGNSILIAVLLAAAGWIWTGRLQRSLLRKQHTFNALLNASFTAAFQDAHNEVRVHLLNQQLPDLNEPGNEKLKTQLVFLLNHYEFLAAGIRNGDISERLLKDSEKGSVISLISVCGEFIESTRGDRKRKATFEHLDWLYDRWRRKPPHWAQRALERILDRPLYHDSHFWGWAAGAAAAAAAASAALIHF